MKNVYYIGHFQFDSYAEYKKGLEDIKKIKCISDELDINEAGVALRLYTLVRQKDITFQSVIGEDYLLYLSDLVADDYKELADTDTYLAGLQKTKSPRRLAGIVCIAVAVLCFLVFLGSEISSYRKNKELMELRENREVSQAAQYIADMLNGANKAEEEQQQEILPPEPEEQPEPEAPPAEESKEILPEFASLYEQNQEMVGWVTIEGTDVDYPVMQSPDSNDYYLKHDFYKEEDNNGCIFLDTRNCLENGDTNLILYGHNMRSGLMFGSLKSYQEESYWQEHRSISFSTLYEKRKYEIVAVCLAKVEYQDEDTFRYYNYLGAGSQEEFDVFKENVSNMNMYENELDISYGDELLTLSTCNNYIEDGRLFLVAKRVE